MTEKDNLQNANGQNHTEQEETHTSNSENETHTDSTVTAENDDDAINEIDDSNAEDAEDEGNNDRHSIPVEDYDKMSLEAMAITLEKLIKNEKPQAIKNHVSALRDTFRAKFDALLEEKKEDFINDGGNEIDFFYTSPVQKRFKTAYKEYRSKLQAHYKSIENNLKQNLKIRLDIIEQIKNLLNVEENINTTYNTFKDLQKEWHNAGPIPREKYNNTWNTYHHHVERFYDFLSLNRELRDKDFEHNLDKKLKIIEKAEALAELSDINFAFRELQNLHKLWKEELGPVAPADREPVWQRFKTATKAIHDKRKDYFRALEETYKENLVVKEDIISKIDAITKQKPNNHKGWQNQIKDVQALREAFFNAGKVPIKVNEATWKKFKDVVRTFNRQKNKYYKDLKKKQYDNLQKKLELVKIAEDNKDNDDFEATTPLMKKIQQDWKSIGLVPRKDSDKVWKQFKAACNAYFDRLHAKRDKANEKELEAFKAKTKILDDLKSFKATGEKQDDLKQINAHIDAWQELERVPKNKRYIEGKFQSALTDLFKSIGISNKEAELIKYDNKLEYLNRRDDDDSLDNEAFFIRKKIDDVKGNINQLENNLQFFTNADESNPLVKNVYTKIETEKKELELWKEKLKKLRQF